MTLSLRISRLARGRVRRAISRKPVGVYYFDEHPNFGDVLGPEILRTLGIRTFWCRYADADLLSVGSILGFGSNPTSALIVGSGIISPSIVTERQEPVLAADSRVISVRGPLSASALGLDTKTTAYGDLGILADRLARSNMSARRVRSKRVGVVFHYADRGTREAAALLENLGRGAPLVPIDVRASPRRVMHQMQLCGRVVSSSLHGLICAHALGLPATWVTLGTGISGGGFKFRDYFASLGIHTAPPTNAREDHGLPWAEISELKKSAVDGVAELREIFESTESTSTSSQLRKS